MWIKEAQQSIAHDEAFKKQFIIFEDENGRGRLKNSNLPFEFKYPILLSRNHPYLRLAIVAAHEHVLHKGLTQTITESILDYNRTVHSETGYTELYNL